MTLYYLAFGSAVVLNVTASVGIAVVLCQVIKTEPEHMGWFWTVALVLSAFASAACSDASMVLSALAILY